MNCFFEELEGDLDIPGFDEEILKQMVSEAEDITDKLSEYGTLDDEEIQTIKGNGERKEQQIQKIEANRESELQPEKEGQNSKMDNGETTEVRKFIICPNCSEKIWL